MALTLNQVVTETVPLRTDEHGVVRVGRSRVTLDTVVAAFRLGATAEQIALEFPTLQLADVYAVISYYLHHQADVDEYLRQREAEASSIQAEIRATYDGRGIRERLLARRATQQSS